MNINAAVAAAEIAAEFEATVAELNAARASENWERVRELIARLRELNNAEVIAVSGMDA